MTARAGNGDPLAGVGKTAIGMAMVRAEESKRADRLFDDPYALAFVEAAPDAFGPEADVSDEQARIGIAFFFAATIRTRFFDDFLTAATRRGCHQVVLLAAGLDTRAYRLEWPRGTKLFEIDLPDVLSFKEQVMASTGAVPSCERTAIPADLRSEWPRSLVERGLDAGTRTAWLAEGILTYLAADDSRRLLERIGELSPDGSELALEAAPDSTNPLLAQARSVADMQEYTELWKGGLGEDVSAWLSSHGWTASGHDLAGLALGYGRPPPPEPWAQLVLARRASPASERR